MLVKTVVLDSNMQEVFAHEMEINALRLMVAAESREEQARKKGAEWTSGAIPFFGGELINAIRGKHSADKVEQQAINVAMCAWLFDSIYCGVTAEAFAKSDLVFTMLPGGAVKYDRVAK